MLLHRYRRVPKNRTGFLTVTATKYEWINGITYHLQCLVETKQSEQSTQNLPRGTAAGPTANKRKASSESLLKQLHKATMKMNETTKENTLTILNHQQLTEVAWVAIKVTACLRIIVHDRDRSCLGNVRSTHIQIWRTPPRVKLPVPWFKPLHGQHLVAGILSDLEETQTSRFGE